MYFVFTFSPFVNCCARANHTMSTYPVPSVNFATTRFLRAPMANSSKSMNSPQTCTNGISPFMSQMRYIFERSTYL